MIGEQQRIKVNTKYSVHLKNGVVKNFRQSELETFMNYIKGNKEIVEVVVNGKNLEIDEELKELLHICKNNGYKSIVEFINYDDDYLRETILRDLEDSGFEALLFRFEYETIGSRNYLMGDKGLMNNVIKSILNASMFNMDIELFVTPLKTNYQQFADAYLLAEEIGVSRIHLGDSKKYGSTLELGCKELKELKVFLSTKINSTADLLPISASEMQFVLKKVPNESKKTY